MNPEELDKELDEWLDRATTGYGKAEIRPGLETRIIANLNTRLEKSRWHFRWIPVAAAITAVLVFSLYVLRTEFQSLDRTEIASKRPLGMKSGGAQRQEGPPGSAAVPVANAGQSNTVMLNSSKLRDTGRQIRARARIRETEGGRFLSSGLSDRERYLIAFARAVSKGAVIGIAEETEFEPLQIPAAEIPPFRVQEFEIPSFKIEALSITASIREEQL